MIASMAVCVDPAFAFSGPRLVLASPGVWRPVRAELTRATADGPYTGQQPSPGRVMIDASTVWVNNTGTDQTVLARFERAPRLLISTNRQGARFHETWTFAAGRNPQPADPNTGIPNSVYGAYSDQYPRWFSPPPAPIVSYSAQDRGIVDIAVAHLEPGEGMSVRYRCSLVTDTLPVVSGGAARTEAYARWVELQIWAGPGMVA